MSKTQSTIPDISKLYDERRNFCVVALTGYTAVGCSRLANYMADPKFYLDDDVRRPGDIAPDRPKDIDNNDIYFHGTKLKNHHQLAKAVFKQKFTICHNFIEANYQDLSFTIIKYTKVLWLMALLQLREVANAEEFEIGIRQLVDSKFDFSTESKLTKSYQDELDAQKEDWKKQLDLGILKIDFAELYEEISNVAAEIAGEPSEALAKIFRTLGKDEKPTCFSVFFEKINEHLFKCDYSRACLFYHRLGSCLRSGVSVLAPHKEVFDLLQKGGYTIDRVYDVVKFITRIVRSLRKPESDNSEKRDCRIVIDRLRLSLEARYLKERYSAFYLIAVHDEDGNSKEQLRKKIIHNYDLDERKKVKFKKLIDLQVKLVMELGEAENKNNDFEKGLFGAPNVSQAVADAEIHISNREKIGQGADRDSPYFVTMAEQWLKYASLIFHPGLITPSSEERCMVVAYTAKFNSGCISRQVGAVITNEAHSIRTIGWNDVPYGQMPCSLRSLRDFSDDIKDSLVHSDLERGHHRVYGDQNFVEKLREVRPVLDSEEIRDKLKGLPYSYCFKSFQNLFEKQKNQVHTRSLHAEENAMLQMVRFGGMPLENGIIYVTASPCELCCKKLYQIGVRKIIYIDEYPGVSRENIIAAGYKRPQLKQFQGAYGTSYFKLYQPMMPYKDELALRLAEEKNEEKRIEDEIKELKEIFNARKLPKMDKAKREQILQALTSHLLPEEEEAGAKGAKEAEGSEQPKDENNKKTK